MQVLGLTSVPTAGDLFLVASDDRTPRQIAEKRQATERAAQLAKRRKVVSLESLKGSSSPSPRWICSTSSSRAIPPVPSRLWKIP